MSVVVLGVVRNAPAPGGFGWLEGPFPSREGSLDGGAAMLTRCCIDLINDVPYATKYY